MSNDNTKKDIQMQSPLQKHKAFAFKKKADTNFTNLHEKLHDLIPRNLKNKKFREIKIYAN